MSLFGGWHAATALGLPCLAQTNDGQDDPPPPPPVPGKSFGGPKEGMKQKHAKGDFRSIKLNNKTHRSTTDPDALLARKSNAHTPSRATGVMCSWTTAMP